MIHIGTCGWVYQDWKGGFYPQDISSEEMLPAYAETFQTVEVNNTFYQLPDADAVRGWDARTPDGFTLMTITAMPWRMRKNWKRCWRNASREARRR